MPFLLGAHLRFDERGDKARHRRFEIAGAAHEKDSDSSLWNFRTRTTFIARLIKGCRVDVRAGCLISEITKHFQRSNEHFSRPDAFTGVFVVRP
jgi:hypothetical protein